MRSKTCNRFWLKNVYTQYVINNAEKKIKIRKIVKEELEHLGEWL